MSILGLDDRNYWNVKPNNLADPWEGTVGYDDFGHAIFIDPIYSGRAAIRTLAQKIKNGLTTLLQIMESYAPRDDGNDPAGYAKFLADRLSEKIGDRFTVDQELALFHDDGRIKSPHLLRALLEAMAEMECYRGFEICPHITRSAMALYEKNFCQ